PAGAVCSDDLVRDGRSHQRDVEHLALGLLRPLGDSGRDLLGLSVPDADPAGPVAHHDQRSEGEPTASPHHLGHAIDRDNPLLQAARPILRRVVPPQIRRPPSRAPVATAATRPWYRRPPRSNTTRSMPASFARLAKSSPTALALAVLSPSALISASEADASVRACRSSMS